MGGAKDKCLIFQMLNGLLSLATPSGSPVPSCRSWAKANTLAADVVATRDPRSGKLLNKQVTSLPVLAEWRNVQDQT